jgi:hypothetical protein
MQTTALIIEYLVVGILSLGSLWLLSCSLFQAEVVALAARLRNIPSSLVTPALTILATLAYAVGVLAEYLGRVLFEWKMDAIKVDRFGKFLQANYPNLRRSPLLASFADKPIHDVTVPKKETLSLVGLMRSYILMVSPPLSGAVELQISRLRLIRPLFLIWLILGATVVRELLRSPSKLLWFALVLIAISAWINAHAVFSRFERYCKEIERAYRLLVFERHLHDKDSMWEP